MKRAAIVMTLLMIIVAGAAALYAQPASPLSNILAQLDTLIAKVDALQTAVNALAPQPKTTTTLLFPFTSNQAGFDTGIAIANTGDTSGSCTIHFIGTNPPAAAVVVPITAAQTHTTLLSFIAPGFQGFIRANCDFPMARGYGFLSDVGVRNFAASVPAEVVQ